MKTYILQKGQKVESVPVEKDAELDFLMSSARVSGVIFHTCDRVLMIDEANQIWLMLDKWDRGKVPRRLTA